MSNVYRRNYTPGEPPIYTGPPLKEQTDPERYAGVPRSLDASGKGSGRPWHESEKAVNHRLRARGERVRNEIHRLLSKAPDGLTVRQIAAETGLSDPTIRRHLIKLRVYGEKRDLAKVYSLETGPDRGSRQSPEARPRSLRCEAFRDAILRLLAHGDVLTSREIAAALDAPIHTVKYQLKTMPVRYVRRPGRYRNGYQLPTGRRADHD